ncbi:bis(5'-nucleosyl)-tetraphosphatase, symmetrical [Shewanella sp. NFH-SH190041]|uniref:symmetrical bis(5'-nucleosyl)-tetraphosphatase n=1 Tax=Shewanella sp. NFH-SH190041 TaxID=2950245 RepID=UPI0021C3E824|nr:symmetrical bis(5'-nucleosyl)-tetraphosphatase [Shewanella sp. NFH-SH190041]BDM65547.1 bis(5'-nucleosyl)-tetraphosphatase, symmetrical [Shewanella sp. NFH-SH190041]
MAHYFVGDLQGCYREFKLLLDKVAFNPSKDEIWAVGDLVARGPDSLSVLRFFADEANSGRVVLGNHDLHLLSVYGGLKRAKPSDQLQPLLDAPDTGQLIDFIRHQPLVRELPEFNLVMTHAGIPPQWDLATLRHEAAAVSDVLQQDNYLDALISHMYGTDINRWSTELSGLNRLIYCINALTRMRYLHPDGTLDFDCKLPPGDAATHDDLRPWFTFNSKLPQQTQVVFGHWAALMGQTHNCRYQALDTGCCWGEYLTLLHLETDEKLTQQALSPR